MFRFLQIAFFFLTISFLIQAREKPVNEWFLINSGGLAFQQVQNFNMSPLLYRGADAAVNIGFTRRNLKVLQNLDFYTWIGNVTPATGKNGFGNPVFVYRINGEYNWLRQREKKLLNADFYYGFSIISANNSRNNNSYSNNGVDYDCSVSLNLTTAIEKSLMLKERQIKIGYQPVISFITYNIVPSFSSTLPEILTKTPDPKFFDYLKAGKIVSLGRSQNIISDFWFMYYLKNGNALRLMYRWDYSNTTVSNRITMAGHSVFFSTLFRIK